MAWLKNPILTMTSCRFHTVHLLHYPFMCQLRIYKFFLFFFFSFFEGCKWIDFWIVSHDGSEPGPNYCFFPKWIQLIFLSYLDPRLTQNQTPITNIGKEKSICTWEKITYKCRRGTKRQRSRLMSQSGIPYRWVIPIFSN